MRAQTSLRRSERPTPTMAGAFAFRPANWAPVRTRCAFSRSPRTFSAQSASDLRSRWTSAFQRQSTRAVTACAGTSTSSAGSARTRACTHLKLASGERAILTGWSGDPVGGTLPDRLVLAVDGIAHGTVQRGIEREDVARRTECPGLSRSGFSAIIRADRLGGGFHRAEVIAFFGDVAVVLDALSFEIAG